MFVKIKILKNSDFYVKLAYSNCMGFKEKYKKETTML